jgi:hypothetical protein
MTPAQESIPVQTESTPATAETRRFCDMQSGSACMHASIRFFASLTDAELSKEVETRAARNREETSLLVASLAEFDARQLHVGMGYPSLYAYCTQHLHLSEHAAYTRIEAARTARRFPVALDMLATGELTLTTLTLLGRHLTADNHLLLLDAARHKTKREVESQVAEIDPRPEMDAVLYPLSGGRCRLEVTLSTEAYDALRRLQELMRHTIPTGDPAVIVGSSLVAKLQQVERQQLAEVRRPRNGLRISHTRYVPAAVKRAIWRRDGSQCAFVGTAGRCQERSLLQLHHRIPFAEGGAASADNLELRCRTHNVYEEQQRAAPRVSPA